jgi:hypothetical protein
MCEIGIIVISVISLMLHPMIMAHALVFISNSTNVFNGKPLRVLIGLSSNPIHIGDRQQVTVTVGEANSSKVLSGATITGAIVNSSNSRQVITSGHTDIKGNYVYSWTSGQQSKPGIYSVVANVSATGYERQSATKQFEVKQK